MINIPDSRDVGAELGDVLCRVMVPLVLELWSPLEALSSVLEALSSVLKALSVRGSLSPPLGERIIAVAVPGIQQHIPPQTNRRAGVLGVLEEL